MTRPENIRHMSRAKLERIARLARATNSFVYDGFTGRASDRRALLLELWGAEVVDGPHGLCDCGEKRTAPGVCTAKGCPFAGRKRR